MHTNKIEYGKAEATIAIPIALTLTLLIILSYFIELEVWRSIFANINHTWSWSGGWGSFQIELAQLFPFTLNAAKILLIFVASYHKAATGKTAIVHITRFSIIIYSFIFSLLLISGQFYNPKINTVYQETLTQIEDRYFSQKIALGSDRDGQLKQLGNTQEADIKRINAYFSALLARAEQGMSDQMKNVVNGVWKGEKYLEFEHQFKTYNQELQAALILLRQERQENFDKINADYKADVGKLNQDEIKALSAESLEKHMGTYAAQNEMVVALIRLINDTLFSGDDVTTAHHITLLITLLVSLAIECSPIVLGMYLFGRMIELNQVKSENEYQSVNMMDENLDVNSDDKNHSTFPNVVRVK